MGDKFKAYRVSLVTADDVANGVAKGDLVYLHSAVPESEGMLFYFTSKPGGDEGVPLLMNQVERAPELDDSGTETPVPGEVELVPESAPLPALSDKEPELSVGQRAAGMQNPRGAGLKFDAGKPRPSLLIYGMPRALMRVADVLTFGAQKYAAHSWKEVENGTERYTDAKLRHMFADAMGEEFDGESTIEHLAHEACNILFLLEKMLIEKEQSDGAE